MMREEGWEIDGDRLTVSTMRYGWDPYFGYVWMILGLDFPFDDVLYLCSQAPQ